MGHDKLRKFAENETFACLLQPAADTVLDRGAGPGLHILDHPVKGHWNGQMFPADQPIVLELGCGKGDYTIALAERHPEMNFIGVDIKGARLWKGAKYATEKGLRNVAFLRTRIEFITAFFGPGEISEIWLTFSDPQLRGSENKRLSSPLFLERYRRFLRPGGLVHLKTDSRFLHEYTRAVIAANGLPILASGTDIYHDGLQISHFVRNDNGVIPSDFPSVIPSDTSPVIPSASEESFTEVTDIQTFYEQMFLEMGLPITYLRFTLDHDGPLVSPADFDADFWREAEGPRRSFSHQPPPQRSK